MNLIHDALSRLTRFISRLLAIVILPGQLPGDVHELLDDLMTAPMRTVRSWSMPVVRALLRQTCQSQKLEIPNDNRLRGMGNYRQRFIGRGWVQQSVSTVDGVSLDGEFFFDESHVGLDARPYALEGGDEGCLSVHRLERGADLAVDRV